MCPARACAVAHVRSKHPEDYAKHPWTFLSQTAHDQGADSCAAKHYHDEMAANGAHSELHIVPYDKMRCYRYGQHALECADACSFVAGKICRCCCR